MRAWIHACIFEGNKTGVRYVSIILYHIFLVEDEHISIQYLFHPLVLLYYFHGQTYYIMFEIDMNNVMRRCMRVCKLP